MRKSHPDSDVNQDGVQMELLVPVKRDSDFNAPLSAKTPSRPTPTSSRARDRGTESLQVAGCSLVSDLFTIPPETPQTRWNGTMT